MAGNLTLTHGDFTMIPSSTADRKIEETYR
jgi:hypothetical protein